MRRLLWTVLAMVLLAASLHAQTQVISRGRASTANATTTPLTSGSTFTGTWEDSRDYPFVSVSILADQNSASSGWKFQWSSDATNLDLQDTYTVTASAGQSQTSVAKARYFRVVYVNGGTNQGVFRLATIFQQGGGPTVGTVTVAGSVSVSDGSGPLTVDGTVTTTPPANASTNWAQIVGTAVDVNSGTKSAGTQRIVIATDQPALTNALKVDGSAVTQPVNGTVTVTQATAANLNAQVQGAGASGAAKAGNPVQQGGVFNTTQPTVTNGQGVEAQMTARGAQIVAPGVDGFAVTGTVTTTPPSNASTNLAQVVGTTADVNSGNKSAGTLRVVLATDQPALTNKLLVTPDSVALPANQSVNAAQLAGTTTDTNSGNKSAGTLRVVLATDQPALTNKLLVTPDSVALPANQSVNVAQFGGTNTVTGTGPSGSGISRVTVANDSNVIITPPTLTKGTQGATGLSVQNLYDAGRTAISFYANNVAAGTTTTETLITLTQSKGTGATSSASTYTITNGKTLRLTGIQVASRGHATPTIQSTVFNLRLNTAGACVVTSTPILMGIQSATPATASTWDRVIIPIPDGYEIAGNGTIALCISAAATYTTNAPTWSVNLLGYEY